MKPFKLIWDNKKPYPNKARIIGIKYEKRYIPSELGIENIIVIYYWRWFKLYSWINND